MAASISLKLGAADAPLRLRHQRSRKLSVNDYMYFHSMRAVYGRMEPFLPTDYAYWKGRGWLEPGTRYFTPHANGHLFTSLFPRFMAWTLGRSVDKGIAKWRASK